MTSNHRPIHATARLARLRVTATVESNRVCVVSEAVETTNSKATLPVID